MIVERPVASKSPDPPAATRPGPRRDPRPLAAATPAAPPADDRLGRWQATHDLACHRAETDRVKVLVDFLARPICAHGGTEPDPDIVTAYNLAVEAALTGIRRSSQAMSM